MVQQPLRKGGDRLRTLFVSGTKLPVVFLAIIATVLSYAVVPVAVAYAYRKRYTIVGKSELAVRFVRRACSGFAEGCRRTAAHALEEYERRKLLKQEKQEKLKRYKRERNRRKREQARRALV